MNQALRRVSLACLVMFLLLLLNTNYVQAFKASSYVNDPQNGRTFTQQYQYQRGSIITADNKTIAESRHVSGIYSYQRYYPDPIPYAAVTGYVTAYSATGIEGAENKLLAGTDPRLTVRNLIDLITGKPKKGATVQLTINSAAQQAAYAALKATGLPSGAVAIDPRTGAILALASYPSFNPNKYATFNGNDLIKADNRYRNSPQQPLLNRAINETFPPGSTFKIVTASTAFSTGRYTPDSLYYAPTDLSLPGTTNKLINYDNLPCGSGGKVPLIYAFTVSCNTVYGGLGLHLGGSALHSQANKFGMNRGLQIPLTVSPSNYPPVSNRLHGVLSDRPVQRRGDAAAGGDVRRRHRQRRHAHAAVPGTPGDRAEPQHAGGHAAVGAEPGGQPRRRSRRVADDGLRGPVPVRHRAQHHPAAGHHHGRGQNGDGAERHQQLRPRRRGLHLFLASHRQPADSRRRRGKGRWPWRGRVRPGGSEDHQGVYAVPDSLAGEPVSGQTRSGTARASVARVTCRNPARRLTTTQDGYDKCET
jgi:Penicillin binding protein transpeptidase domain